MLSVSQLADLINVLSINGNKAANCTPAKPVFMWQIHIREIRWRIWNTNQRVSNSYRNTHLFSILSYHYHLKSFLSSLRLRDCIKTDKKKLNLITTNMPAWWYWHHLQAEEKYSSTIVSTLSNGKHVTAKQKIKIKMEIARVDKNHLMGQLWASLLRTSGSLQPLSLYCL